MYKKVFAMMMAVVMMASCMAGCGGTEKTEAPANVIKIGGIGPLTGDAATYGLATRNGAQIAVDELNAKGGLQLQLNFQDDEADGEKAVNAYNTLKDWGMQILYGCTTTGSSVTVAGKTFNDRCFQLTPSASSPDVTSGKDNVFQLCFNDHDLGATPAQYIFDKKLASKVAVLYNNGDPYSTGVANDFLKRAEEIGLEVSATVTFPDDKNTDFSVQLNEAKSSGADLVFMPIYYTPASLILAQAKDMNYQPVFFGGDGMDGLLKIKGFDTSLAEGLMLMTPFNASSSDERTQNFVKTYTEKYGDETLNQFAADGYDCIYAIYDACQKAGVTPETKAEEACEKLVAVFTSADFKLDGLTGTAMHWSTNGQVSKEPLVVEVHQGEYVSR